jgi:hypothetical protein
MNGNGRTRPAAPRRGARVGTVIACLLSTMASAGVPNAEAATHAGAQVEVPLVVRETAGAARAGAPAVGGIPLPREPGVMDVGQLRLLAADGATPVPCQFTVLSRWFARPDDGRGPISWVRLDFLADVPAGGSARYVLRASAASATRTATAPAPVPAALCAASDLTQAIDVRDSGDRLVVSTGALTVAVSKTRFSLFEEVDLPGGSTSGDGGPTSHRVVRSDTGNGLVIQRLNGSRYYSQAAAPNGAGTYSATVEQGGPLMAVIRLAGTLVPGTANLVYAEQTPGLDYVVRLFFYRGRSFVRGEVRLGYPERSAQRGIVEGGAPVGHEFKELLLRVRAALNGEVRATVGGEDSAVGAAWSGTLGAGQEATVHQRSSGAGQGSPGSEGRAMGFAVTAPGRSAPRFGWRAAGWADASDANAGLTVAIRRFWQEFPKALTVSHTGDVSLALFPEPSGEAFRLDGGRRTMNEVLFYFHTGGADGAASAQAAADFLHPLRVCATPEWYALTGDLTLCAVEDEGLFPHYERLVRNMVEPRNGGGTLAAEREAADAYGWLNYGDLPLDGREQPRRWNNNDADFAHALLMQSLRRTASAEDFFEAGAALVRHQVMVDTYAAAHDDSRLAGGHRGPDPAGRPDHTALPALDASHPRGVLLYYVLTGETWALEAGLEWARWVGARQRLQGKAGELLGLTDVAALGTIIDGLLDLYLVTGEAAHLSRTQWVLNEMVVPPLRDAGYIRNPAGSGAQAGAVSPPAVGRVAAALGRYAALMRRQKQPDPAAEDALKAALTFLAEKAWSAKPTVIDGRTHPGALATLYRPDDQSRAFECVAAQEAMDACVYGYDLFGRPDFLAAASALFRAAFDGLGQSSYYRSGQISAAPEMARLVGPGHVALRAIQAAEPQIGWFLSSQRSLTKDSVGAYPVQVRVRRVPAGAVPQLNYALDDTPYVGWRDMHRAADRPGVWELSVPDLNWRRLAAHRLHLQVRLMGADRVVIGHPVFRTVLIQSLDLPPRIYPVIAPVEVAPGGSATVELAGRAVDSEDPPEALRWTVADVNAALLAATIDEEHQWLLITARESTGEDTITVILRDSAGNAARQSVRVTVRAAP